MRISDWSSDVCSSDLGVGDVVNVLSDGVWGGLGEDRADRRGDHLGVALVDLRERVAHEVHPAALPGPPCRDRKSVVSGKSVSVRVDLGGRRIIQKKKSSSIQRQMSERLTTPKS